ncbi:unnamed protein product [Acanthoscelides obtectus]|uniref:Uncharacterized protein n=1 Tax=Acanthoscelides obtectus TaxID=200917 RepID=A0A9P0VR90_ACAOB|nr:unnamed protein product [Acanthoscelides obtectus]
MQDLVRQWKAKPLHGRYRSRIEDNAIDTKASQGWLQSGNLFLETEGFIASIQDQNVKQLFKILLLQAFVVGAMVTDVPSRVPRHRDPDFKNTSLIKKKKVLDVLTHNREFVLNRIKNPDILKKKPQTRCHSALMQPSPVAASCICIYLFDIKRKL